MRLGRSPLQKLSESQLLSPFPRNVTFYFFLHLHSPEWKVCIIIHSSNRVETGVTWQRVSLPRATSSHAWLHLNRAGGGQNGGGDGAGVGRSGPGGNGLISSCTGWILTSYLGSTCMDQHRLALVISLAQDWPVVVAGDSPVARETNVSWSWGDLQQPQIRCGMKYSQCWCWSIVAQGFS